MMGAVADLHELYPGQSADFLSEARRAFGFLEEQGFELREADPQFLEWESPEAIVVVGLRPGPDGAYRGVHAGLAPAGERDDERYLPLFRIEELRPPPDDAPFKPLRQARLPARDRDEMRASLARLAELLRTQFAEPLASGREGLRALQQESRRRGAEAAQKVREYDLRKEAHEAFDARDYARATMLYEAAGDDLRPAERKRLDIARRRAGLG
jgi:hypothetical protein